MKKKTKIKGFIVGLNFRDNEVVIKLDKGHDVGDLQDICYKETQIYILL